MRVVGSEAMRPLFLALLLGCGSPDAGGPTLTVLLHAQGIATSEPPGISCGSCPASLGSAVCPDPTPHTACSFTFETGQVVQLGLNGQELYFSISCSTGSGSDVQTFPNCTFTIDGPLTITITGSEA